MTETELQPFFEVEELSSEVFDQYADQTHESWRAREKFADAVSEYRRRVEAGEGDPLRLALGLLIVGKHGDALEWFAKAPDDKLRHYYAAEAALALGRSDEAMEELRAAGAGGWDALAIDMAVAAVQIGSGNSKAADKLVDKQAKAGADRHEWYYVRGLLAEYDKRRGEALVEYEKSLTLFPEYAPGMFRCAWLYDIRGDDEQAIELYERLARRPRARVNALINLAVSYEDVGKYDDALECLRRVLKAYPNHARARLFYRDVESSAQMVIDEGVEVTGDTSVRLLETPISEFELSVRARNCLKKMKIHTLGDLLRLSEAELLAYKNFGETSLNEIKAMLSQKGLRIGQRPDELGAVAADVPAPAPTITVPPGSEAMLAKGVGELELSVRARRCLQRLDVATLGELIQHSEPELLSIRNFGVTSLNEIKARLGDHGLQLAPKSG